MDIFCSALNHESHGSCLTLCAPLSYLSLTLSMSRSIILISLLLITLSACSLPGTQTETSVGAGLSLYTGSGFTMNVPDTWVNNTTATLPIPRHGTISMTAVSPEVRYGFSNNIIIMQDTLDTPMTSRKYSELNQIQTTRNYLEYTKLSDDVILFGDEDESRVYVFEARYNTTTQRMKFIQTAKVCGTKVYLMHAAIALDKDAANYVSLFKSFQCK
jgi:hypothetical protein